MNIKIMKIGITERGDAAYNTKWTSWVKAGKPAVLITKDPARLFEILKQIDNPNIIIHCTITGNSGTFFEENVPDWTKSLLAYVEFIKKYGKDRVILRIDPIIPVQPYLENSYDVLSEARRMLLKAGIGMTRVRVSFLDNYDHVKKRISDRKKIKILDYDFHADLNIRQYIWNKMGKPELCGEPGMESTGCISAIDCKILGVEPEESVTGQRKACRCLSNKIELLNTPEQCENKCLYCYWKKEKENGTGLF